MMKSAEDRPRGDVTEPLNRTNKRIDASGHCCTTRRQSAHGTEARELLYPWHPWTGHQVHVHEVIDKGGREVCRCSLSGCTSDRWLEVPAWMFDQAARATWRMDAGPHVDMAILCLLATLLKAAPVSTAVSHSPVSVAGLSPHDANRGDAHGSPTQHRSARSVRSPARSEGGGDTTMASAPRRSSPGADQADGPPDPRPRRRPRSSSEGAPP